MYTDANIRHTISPEGGIESFFSIVVFIATICVQDNVGNVALHLDGFLVAKATDVVEFWMSTAIWCAINDQIVFLRTVGSVMFVENIQ